MELWDADALGRVRWPDSELGRLAAAYLEPIARGGMSAYVENAHGVLHVLRDGDLVTPVVVADTRRGDTYVVSVSTQFSDYPVEEIRRYVAPRSVGVACALPRALGVLLRAARADRCVFVNNWLVSTALYPDVEPRRFVALAQFLVERYPDHAIVFRSLNALTTPDLIDELSRAGCMSVVSRIVYVMPRGAAERAGRGARRRVRRDRAMFGRSGYELHPLDPVDARAAESVGELYRRLYIDKYSRLNPRYTLRFFRETLARGALRYFVLRRGGRTDGVMGIFQLGGVLTAPVFGYDTSIPKSVGLYRMLSAATLDLACREGLVDHASAGVGGFKAGRGYLPQTEYSAVFTRHLSPARRAAWRMLEGYGRRVTLPVWRRFDVESGASFA